MQELAVDLPARLKLADHTVTKRVIILTLRGLLPGAGGAFGAIALLKLIALMTNVFWYKQFSFAENPMPGNASALHILAAPFYHRCHPTLCSSHRAGIYDRYARNHKSPANYVNVTRDVGCIAHAE